MSYHRFIGGLHDGEWLDVRRPDGLFLPPIWTVQQRPGVRFDPAVQTVEPVLSRRTDYKPMPLHHGKVEVVTFFIEYNMTPEEALLRLAACYKPVATPSDAEVKG